MPKTSTGSKILRAFALQLVLISGATILGVLVTNWIVEDLLSQEALRAEAAHFWQKYQADTTTPLPDTANLLGFLGPRTLLAETAAGVPQELASLTPGYGRVVFHGARPLVHVSDQGDKRLYLVFAQERVSALTFYFGLVPLILVLLAIYVLAFLTYRSSHQALSPFVALANYLEQFDFRPGASLDVQSFRQQGNAEIDSLVEAITHLAGGWEAALERERVFTRDAGHELRTPLAVFKGSLDLLQQQAVRPKHDTEALQRMRRTANDMEALLTALLLLAREPEPSVQMRTTGVADVIEQQVQQLQPLADQQGIELRFSPDQSHNEALLVSAPDQVLNILVGNLLRNAINYTPSGQVELVIEGQQLRVKDSGVGIPPQEVNNVFNAFFRGARGRETAPGHGLGLAIVKRIVDRYGWQVTVQSELGLGTEFRIDFG